MTTRRGSAASRCTRPAASSRTAAGSSSCSSGCSAAWTTSGSRVLGHRDRALEQDRPGVDALVDEVDRHADDLDAVVDRLLDRPDARERGQQRRVDVDDAVGEPGRGTPASAAPCSPRGRPAPRRGPAPSRPSRCRAPCGPRSRRAGTPPSAARRSRRGRARAPPPGRSRRRRSRPRRPWTRVDERLEVRPLARDEDDDAHDRDATPPRRASGTGRRSTRAGPSASSSSTRASTSSARAPANAPYAGSPS